MSFREIEEQAVAVSVLERALDKGLLAHAYLFEGPRGVGKRKTALALAGALLCEQTPNVGCGECSVCKRVGQGTHPDVRIFAPREEGNGNIQVEFLRDEILPFTQYAPFEAKAAVVIFPDADVSLPMQHPEAANALLKTLEEPRKNLHFVLTTSRPAELLITIRSRCQRLRFGGLSDALLERIITRSPAGSELEEKVVQDIVRIAGGSAKLAFELIQGTELRELNERVDALEAALATPGPGRLVQQSDSLGKSDELPLLLDLFALRLLDRVRSNQVEHGPKQEAWLRAFALLHEARLILQNTNAQPELLLNKLFFQMRLPA